MKQEKYRKTGQESIGILIGTGMMAAATNWVFEPMQLVTGGVTGLGIVIKNLTGNIIGDAGIPLWITNIVCNIPLFIFGYYLKGSRFLRKGLISSVIFTIWLGILPVVEPFVQDMLLNTILGAVMMGAGLGLVFATGTTTGGMDLLAILLQRKYAHWSEAQILAIVDGIVVVLGAAVFGLEHALYALVAIFIVTKTSDAITNGIKYTKVAYVISGHSAEISRRLLEELQRGVTGIRAVGMHTGENKQMLMCVVSRKEIVTWKKIVFEIDSDAFVIVTDAREAVGEGFGDYRAEYTRKED